jgi:Tol biopolymer transport system component
MKLYHTFLKRFLLFGGLMVLATLTATAQSAVSTVLNPSSGPQGTTVSISLSPANQVISIIQCRANGSPVGQTFTVNQASGTVSVECTYYNGEANVNSAPATFTVTAPPGLQDDTGGGQLPQIQDPPQINPGNLQPPDIQVPGQIDPNDLNLPNQQGGTEEPQPPSDPNQPAPQPQPQTNQPDADGDGVPDGSDRCPFVSGRGNQFGGVTGADGCPVDSDGDGANDGVDACPFDPSTTAAPCGAPQDNFDANAATDSDGDGVPDSNDACPNNPGGGTADGCPQDDPQPVITLPTLPEDGTCYLATPSTTPVNVRQGPSVTTNIVGGLNPANFYESQFVEVNPQGETWYSVTSEQGNPGYVRSDVIRGSSACANLGQPQDDGSGLVPNVPALPDDGTCYIATPDIAPVDVYEQPDLTSPVIGQMDPQTVYESLFRAQGPQGNTYHTVTLASGVDGYVFIPDIRGTAPCGNTPAVPGQQQFMLGSEELCTIRSRDGSDLDVFIVTTIEDRRAGSFLRDAQFEWYNTAGIKLPGNRPYFPIGVDGFTEQDRGVTRVEGRAYLVDTYTPVGQVRGFINQADVIVENPELCSDLPAVEGNVRQLVSPPMVVPPTPRGLFNYVGGTQQDITLPPQCGSLQESFDNLPATMRIVLLNERDNLSEAEQCDLAESLVESAVFRERLSSFSQNWLDDAAECPADFMALAAYAERVYHLDYPDLQRQFENILNANENLCGIAGQLANQQLPAEFQTIDRIVLAAGLVCTPSPGIEPVRTEIRIFRYPDAPNGESAADFLRSGQPGGELCRQMGLVNRIGDPKNPYIQTAYTELTETCDYPRIMERAGSGSHTLELVADMRRQNVNLAVWQENLNCTDPTSAIELAEPHPVVASRSADIPPALAECRTIARELANNSGSLSVGELFTIFNSNNPCETARDYVQTLQSPGVFQSFKDLRCSVGPTGESNVPGAVDEDLRLSDGTIITDDAPYSTKALLASQDINGLCNGDPVVRNLGASSGSGDTIPSDVSDVCWGVMLAGSLPNRQNFSHDGFPMNAALATHVETADGPVRIPETHLQQSERIPWDGSERFLTFTAYVPQSDAPNRYPVLVLGNNPSMTVKEIFFGEVPEDACVSGEFPLDYVTQQTQTDFTIDNQGNIEPADPNYTLSPEMFNPDIQRVEFDLEIAPPPDLNVNNTGGVASSATVDDIDGDDIPNADDACPSEAGPDNPVGCPLDQSDPDGDGIPTYADDCPNQPGRVLGVDQVNGCPDNYDPQTDADGDGLPDVGDLDQDSITNNKDQCPNQPGRTATTDPSELGCPVGGGFDPGGDADRDGIPNNTDACPYTLGEQQANANLNGCPTDFREDGDQDDDGIPITTDACYNQAGPPNENPELNGCPPNGDQDGDSVPNIIDDCPVNAGIQRPNTDLHGCPAAVTTSTQPQPGGNTNAGGTGGTTNNTQPGAASGGQAGANNVSLPPNFSNPAPRPPVYGGFTQPTVNTSSDTTPGTAVAAPDTSPVYVQPAGNNIQANTPPILEDENQIGGDLLALSEKAANLGGLTDAYGVFGVTITEGETDQSNIYTFENGELIPLLEPTDGVRVAYPAVSPDGKFIAYLRNENNGENITVMLYSRDNDLNVPLFEATENMRPGPFTPVWFPDGSAVLVTIANAEGDTSVYSISAESLSSEPELLIENASSPSVATNGRNVAFVRPESENPERVNIVLRSLARDAETTLTNVETGYQCYAPGFGQDSITVYFLCSSAEEQATGLFKYGVGSIEQILIETGATSGVQSGPVNGLLTYANRNIIYLLPDTDGSPVPLIELGENVLVDSISWQSNSNPIPSAVNTVSADSATSVE